MLNKKCYYCGKPTLRSEYEFVFFELSHMDEESLKCINKMLPEIVHEDERDFMVKGEMILCRHCYRKAYNKAYNDFSDYCKIEPYLTTTTFEERLDYVEKFKPLMFNTYEDFLYEETPQSKLEEIVYAMVETAIFDEDIEEAKELCERISSIFQDYSISIVCSEEVNHETIERYNHLFIIEEYYANYFNHNGGWSVIRFDEAKRDPLFFEDISTPIESPFSSYSEYLEFYQESEYGEIAIEIYPRSEHMIEILPELISNMYIEKKESILVILGDHQDINIINLFLFPARMTHAEIIESIQLGSEIEFPAYFNWIFIKGHQSILEQTKHCRSPQREQYINYISRHLNCTLKSGFEIHL